MPDSSDDVPARTRGAVRPPPSFAPGDAPEAIDVPRMSPPPPSLEALVEGRKRSQKSKPKSSASAWWFWAVALLLTAGLTVYVLR